MDPVMDGIPRIAVTARRSSDLLIVTVSGE